MKYNMKYINLNHSLGAVSLRLESSAPGVHLVASSLSLSSIWLVLWPSTWGNSMKSIECSECELIPRHSEYDLIRNRK